jgi:hypothetical protein
MEIYRTSAILDGNMVEAAAKNEGECKERCASQGSCGGATFIKSTRACRIYTEVYQYSPDKDAETYIKRQQPKAQH